MTEHAAAREAEQRLQAILKAMVVGARTQDPASRPGGEDLVSAGALWPADLNAERDVPGEWGPDPEEVRRG